MERIRPISNKVTQHERSKDGTPAWLRAGVAGGVLSSWRSAGIGEERTKPLIIEGEKHEKPLFNVVDNLPEDHHFD